MAESGALALQDGVAAECGHAFCRACITEYLEAAEGVASCQACEKPLTIDLHNAPVVCSLPYPIPCSMQSQSMVLAAHMAFSTPGSYKTSLYLASQMVMMEQGAEIGASARFK